VRVAIWYWSSGQNRRNLTLLKTMVHKAIITRKFITGMEQSGIDLYLHIAVHTMVEWWTTWLQNSGIVRPFPCPVGWVQHTHDMVTHMQICYYSTKPEKPNKCMPLILTFSSCAFLMGNISKSYFYQLYKLHCLVQFWWRIYHCKKLSVPDTPKMLQCACLYCMCHTHFECVWYTLLHFFTVHSFRSMLNALAYMPLYNRVYRMLRAQGVSYGCNSW